jgi:hypothetical protein
MRIVGVALVLSASLLARSLTIGAQSPGPVPRVVVQAASALRLPAEVDSNSPAVWDRIAGQNTLFLLMSMSGQPLVAAGIGLTRLGSPAPVVVDPWPGGGIWIESVIPDVDGTWYGFYHNENAATMCRGVDKVIPRIGAMRSHDRGRTWIPLGVVLEAPPRSYDCSTENKYFVGGVGDFSVQLDAASQDLYFFYSQYLSDLGGQGVGIARLAWADRDDPTGRIMVWQGGVWIPTMLFGQGRAQRLVYPAGEPIFPAAESWHNDNHGVDAFWGPSVHWNTHLGQYVMLLNRAMNGAYDQEGIYVSFAPSLDDPRAWSHPTKILNGGAWYPQVVGSEDGTGTDRTAGEYARLFMLGTSRHLLRFVK